MSVYSRCNTCNGEMIDYLCPGCLLTERDRLKNDLEKTTAMLEHVIGVIADVHKQRADDLCWMDVDKIFAAAGLPVPDRRVGDKAAMLANCGRFIETMCAGGGWKSYAELEGERGRLADVVAAALRWLRGRDALSGDCKALGIGSRDYGKWCDELTARCEPLRRRLGEFVREHPEWAAKLLGEGTDAKP